MKTGRSHFLLAAVVGGVFGLGMASNSIVAAVAAPMRSQANPQEPYLYANLYMQTSAEYRALCLQTYSMGAERLRQKISATRGDGPQPAVVMDLDETVIDNSGYQSFLDKYSLQYTDAYWNKWEKDFPNEVRLIPGAKAFIEGAEAQGVAVVYVSNRLEANRTSTIDALRHVGLNTADIGQRLLLKTTTSDKTARRVDADKRFRVLMYFGDNLRDFSEDFLVAKLDANDEAGQRKAIADRLAKVDRNAYRWGTDWIVLPNPVYGEWTKPLGPNPRTKLNGTAMRP